MVEQDVIGHLIDVERQAYDLLLDAQTESDKRKAEAKEKAEQLFLSQYEKIVSDLDVSFEKSRKACDASTTEEYAKYTDRLNSISRDQKSLNAYLDSFFFEK